MGYDLRERKQKSVIQNYESDEDGNESDSKLSDPDYSTRMPPRKINSCKKSMQELETEDNEIIYSSRNGKIQRRRGCSSKKGANKRNGEVKSNLQGQEIPKKKRKVASCKNQELDALSIMQPRIAQKTVLSWLISHGEIHESDRIQYIMRSVIKEGILRTEGVWCRCCNKVLTVWEFEIHAGSHLARPYYFINVIRTDKSLIKHLVEVWDRKNEEKCEKFNLVLPQLGATDGNDDACLLCADGGDLICCENCPSTFHPSCLGMESIPQEDWFCIYCLCKFCGVSNGTMLTCHQCGKKYHWRCYFDGEHLDLNTNELTLFCGSICRKVHGKLQRLIGVKHKLKDGFSWTLLQRTELFEIDDEHTRLECDSKIAVAWELLNECFMTITDRHSQINILQNVVYNRGSNLKRMNFKGFYIAVLEKNDGIVSAATIRIHGNELAEMPFIATRQNYRFKGMSRMLFDAFEYIFSSTGIKHLVIPSLPQLANMWQGKYGFSPIDDVVKQKLVNFNTLMFPGTVRLQKNFPGTYANSSAAMEIDENCKRLAILNLNLAPPEPADDEVVKPVTWNG